MRTRWAWAVAALGLSAGAWAGVNRPAAGIVTAVKGKPSVRREATGSAERVKAQTMVYDGDELKTGTGEVVSLALTGGAEFKMNENSTFVVESGGSGRAPASLFTSLGDAWTRLLSHAPGAGLNIRTPVAVAAVRGTEGDIETAQNQLTVKTYDGTIELMNAAGTKSLAKLTAGQMSSVGGSGTATPPKTMGPADKGNWQVGLAPSTKALNSAINALNQAASKHFLQIRDKDGHVINLELKEKGK